MEKAARSLACRGETHESSKAENKYDTRGLEAAYLAGGQARQAKEISDSLKLYETMTPRDFAPGEPIDLTALVELDTNGARASYFIGPRSGGSGNLAASTRGNHGHHAAITVGRKFDGPKIGRALDGQNQRNGGKVSRHFGWYKMRATAPSAVDQSCSEGRFPHHGD